jgi:hypothetical protein
MMMFHVHALAISQIRPVIMERAVLGYCGKFTLATLSVMTGLIRDIAHVFIFLLYKISLVTWLHQICRDFQFNGKGGGGEGPG